MTKHTQKILKEFREKFVDNLGCVGGQVWKIKSTNTLIADIEDFLIQKIEEAEKRVYQEVIEKIQKYKDFHSTHGMRDENNTINDILNSLSPQDTSLDTGRHPEYVKKECACHCHYIEHNTLYCKCMQIACVHCKPKNEVTFKNGSSIEFGEVKKSLIGVEGLEDTKKCWCYCHYTLGMMLRAPGMVNQRTCAHCKG